MKNTFLERLATGEVLLADGAMGTEVRERSSDTVACPEALNLEAPELVQGIYRDYLEAGADIIETNTFGGNRFRLAQHGLEGKLQEINRRAVELAREIVPAERFVAGSIGPTGEMLAPFGTMHEQEAFDAFAEQAEALATAGVDVLFIETMMALEEIEIAIEAVRAKTALPVIASMTFELGKAGLRTMWGVEVPQMVQRLGKSGADVIGSNCGRGFDEMIEVIRAMRPLTEMPIIAQSNAGIPVTEGGQSVYKETPEVIAPRAQELLDLGVNILGGCCGTTPEHIRKMRELVDAHNRARA